MPGQLTLRLHESVVRLGTGLPFAQAAEALAFFTGVTVATVRRRTEGAWAEGKHVAMGTVGPPVRERGEWMARTEELSYVSRLTDAETVGRLALVETPRRGTETAKPVWAVQDGAEWMQGFVGLHRPDAGRIRDFPHA